MAISVHTNKAALTALQHLAKTNENLNQVQNRINSGYKVSNAKDNAAVYAVAQGQRADLGALEAVKSSLDRATSITDVAMAAGESLSDLLNELKKKVIGAMDPSADANVRGAYNTDFKALLRQITSVIRNAEFDGANLLDGSLTGDIRFLANADADAYVTLTAKNLSLGGAILTVAATASIGTATLATGVLAQVNTSIDQVNAALGELGAQARAIESHNTFIAKLANVIEAGIGSLVDADLAKESARLQALQVQQQLGTQALSIANQAPTVVLSLFRS